MQVIETVEEIPAPFMDEAAIRQRVAERRAEIEAVGGRVVVERRHRNIAFDRRGEKTSTTLVVEWP